MNQSDTNVRLSTVLEQLEQPSALIPLLPPNSHPLTPYGSCCPSVMKGSPSERGPTNCTQLNNPGQSRPAQIPTTRHLQQTRVEPLLIKFDSVGGFVYWSPCRLFGPPRERQTRTRRFENELYNNPNNNNNGQRNRVLDVHKL